MSAVIDEPSPTPRIMREADLESVLEIEEASYDFPWSAGIFNDCLRIGYCCRVVEVECDVVGYGILSVAAGEAHLLNLCIAPDYRERGVAAVLLGDLMDAASALGAATLFLEVRPSNRAARALYRRQGFKEIGIRRHYYPAQDGREDALVLTRALAHVGG